MSDFRIIQISVGGFDNNFSYLVYANKTSHAAIIDPCGDVEKIQAALAGFKEINPAYILLTHGHFDHISGLHEIKDFFKAPVAANYNSPVPHDISLKDGQKLPMGSEELYIEAISTPGHTNDSITYRLSDNSGIFTGDTLFIDCIGFCDPKIMFQTLGKIKQLDGENIVYSGHDYGTVPFRKLCEEIKLNPYLKCNDISEFRELLRSL